MRDESIASPIEWREIPGLPGFHAGFDGSIRDPDGVIVRPTIDGEGYASIKVGYPGDRWSAKAHRLVASAFHGECPQGMECCHNDSNPSNNRADNLRWDTKSENARDRFRPERNGPHGHQRADLNRQKCLQALASIPKAVLQAGARRNQAARARASARTRRILTLEQAAEIHILGRAGWEHSEIARRYNVLHGTVRNILIGASYRDV